MLITLPENLLPILLSPCLWLRSLSLARLSEACGVEVPFGDFRHARPEHSVFVTVCGYRPFWSSPLHSPLISHEAHPVTPQGVAS